MPSSQEPTPAGRLVSTALESELRRSYLEYALSVIVGRALPDVHDGLKPVQRRILYGMYRLGLTAGRPHRKSARVVGEVLGKYHPHGDQSVYAALVRLVQDFNCRYPLVDGQGNFGSVDDDPAAAMRYTEARLTPLAQTLLLDEIDQGTVSFQANFDSSEQEPQVLPAQLPLLLLNGCTGIAVGMATAIPPHNLGELVDVLLALIDYPHLTEDRFLDLLPGPDFPTGGRLPMPQEVAQVYRSGRGPITLRGIAHSETMRHGRRNRQALVITELPYQVSKAAWIARVAELVQQGRLEGIADLRDESDREGLRVVVELRPGFLPHQVEAQLFHHTPLESQFHVSLLAVVDGRPQHYSLRELLVTFLRFREATLIRRYRHELTQVSQKHHLLTGLHTAIANLEQVFLILRQSRNPAAAQARLVEQFDLSQAQAAAVLATPLGRLTQMEVEQVEQERQKLADRMTRLRTLVDQRPERLKDLKRALKALKRQFQDERRTRLGPDRDGPTVPPAAGRLLLTVRGMAEWHTDEAQTQAQLAFPIPQVLPRSADPPCWSGWAASEDRLALFTPAGRVWILPVATLPQNQKVALQDWGWGGDAPLLAVLVTPASPAVILASQRGRLWVLAPDTLWQQTWTLPADDVLVAVAAGPPEQSWILASQSGRVLHTQITLAPGTHGRPGLSLEAGDQLVACLGLDAPAPLAAVSSLGAVAWIESEALKPAKLGAAGRRIAKQGCVGLVAGRPGATLYLRTDRGRLLSRPLEPGPGPSLVGNEQVVQAWAVTGAGE
ncbi:MAG: DNA topoisomerase IV [Gloeomargaritaceae cyanobacterium C42_A2020_066]|nr:DNA topoisomerase IV [Gloeomargaritaceae cyanobacterium C42_A2020_066]